MARHVAALHGDRARGEPVVARDVGVGRNGRGRTARVSDPVMSSRVHSALGEPRGSRSVTQGRRVLNEWRAIPGWPYEVSSDGRVRRVGGRELSQRPNHRGYPTVNLSCGPERKRTARVHRLVMEAFVGPCPDGLHVNHIDGNKRNARPENLEYVTPRENMAHAIRTGLSLIGAMPAHLRARGERMNTAKLTDERVVEMRETYASTPVSVYQLSLKYGVDRRTVKKVLLGLTWTHVGGPVGPIRPRTYHAAVANEGGVAAMAETKWTPGPWGREDDVNPEMITAGVDAEGAFVYVADVSWGAPANAPLIAAAPDLYAALERLLEEQGCGCCTEPSAYNAATEAARSALARARGEG